MSPHVTGRPRTCAALATAAIIVSGLLTACGSSTNTTTATPPSTDTALRSGSVLLPATSSRPPSPSSNAPDPVRVAGVYTASDSSGNKGSLVISLGTIQTASKITSPVIQACDSDIAQVGSSFDRTLAVPITVQVQLSSSLASTVSVNLAKQYVAVAGGAPSSAGLILLAKGYSTGPECDTINGNAQIVWQNAPPGVGQIWHGYILEPNAITPNEPTGGNSDIFRLLLDPTVSLSAGSLADLHFITTDSPYEVLCQYPQGGGPGWQLLAIEPSRVLNYGCSQA